jgi:hypothetical protein
MLNPDGKMMARAPAAGQRFCIVLGRRENPADDRNGDGLLDAPMGLDPAIENGASPILLTMLEAPGCKVCSVGLDCDNASRKKMITQKVDDRDTYVNGLLDLPYIVRDIRADSTLGSATDMHLGVYMENLSRLEAERSGLRSQRSDSPSR